MCQSTIQPDSPFRNGTKGKYKLLIKSVTEMFGSYKYLLLDAEGKEYKAESEMLYSEGEILRCMVSFKGERLKLVVNEVDICKKQNLAIPVKIEKKLPNNESVSEFIYQLKNEFNIHPNNSTQRKEKSIEPKEKTIESKEKYIDRRLGNPKRKLVSGIYNFLVTNVKLSRAGYSCLVKDATGTTYPFLSKQYLMVGEIYSFTVNVSLLSNGILQINILSVIGIKNRTKKEAHNQNKKKVKEKKSPKNKSNMANHQPRYNYGYKKQDYEPTIYKGGIHLIYTPMGNKR